VGYAEMGGVGNEEEAAARMSAALGLPSYPLPVNETLRLCTWLKSRPASSGYLGEHASSKSKMKSQHTLTCLVIWAATVHVLAYLYIHPIFSLVSCCLDSQDSLSANIYTVCVCVYICTACVYIYAREPPMSLYVYSMSHYAVFPGWLAGAYLVRRISRLTQLCMLSCGRQSGTQSGRQSGIACPESFK